MQKKLKRIVAFALMLSFAFDLTAPPAYAREGENAETRAVVYEGVEDIHDIAEYKFLPGMEKETGAAVNGNPILEAGVGRKEMNDTGGVTVDMKLDGTMIREKNVESRDKTAVNMQFANSFIWFDKETLHIPGADDVAVNWDLDKWHTYTVTREKKTDSDGNYKGYQISFYVDNELKLSGFNKGSMMGNSPWTQKLSLYNFVESDSIRSTGMFEVKENIHDIAEYKFLPGMETEGGAAVGGENSYPWELGAGRSEMNGTGGVTVSMKLEGTKVANSAVKLQFANSHIWFDKKTLHIPGAGDVTVDWDVDAWHDYKITREEKKDSKENYTGYQISFYVDGELKSSGFSTDPMKVDNVENNWNSALSLYNFTAGDFIRSVNFQGDKAKIIEAEANIHDIAEYKFLPGMETNDGVAVTGTAINMVGAGRSEMDGTGGFTVGMRLDGTKNENKTGNNAVNMQFGNTWIWFDGTKLHVQGNGADEVPLLLDLAQWHTYKITRQRATYPDGSYAGYQICFYVDGEQKYSGFNSGSMMGNSDWLQTLSLFKFTAGDSIRSTGRFEAEANIHDITEYPFLSGMETEAGAAVTDDAIMEVGVGQSEMDGTGGVTVSMKLEGTTNRQKNAENRDLTAVNIQLANSWIWFDNTTLHIPGADDVTVDWNVAAWHTYKITRQRTTYPDNSYMGYKISFYVDDQLKAVGFSTGTMTDDGAGAWRQTLSLYRFAKGDYIRSAAKQQEIVVKEMDVETYKKKSSDSNEWTDPEEPGRVFAGWFTDESCEIVYTGTEGKAYAKFVNATVLTVKGQLKDRAEGVGTDTLRFVSSVDTLDYKEVGFNVTYTYKGKEYQNSVSRTTVYGTMNAGNGEIIPADFSKYSQYLFGLKLTSIPADASHVEFQVTPYWVTLDGTKVESTQENNKFTVDYLRNYQNNSIAE